MRLRVREAAAGGERAPDDAVLHGQLRRAGGAQEAGLRRRLRHLVPRHHPLHPSRRVSNKHSSIIGLLRSFGERRSSVKPYRGSCHKRQKPQAVTAIRNRQTRKVANAKIGNR